MLSLAEIESARPRGKPYKIFDGGGLFLHVAKSGLKTFRLKYRVAGKEQQAVIGRYPECSLEDARDHGHAMKAALKRDRSARVTAPLPCLRPQSINEVEATPGCSLYFVLSPCGHVKIGISDDPVARLRDIQVGYPQKLRLLGIMAGSRARERYLHLKFARFRKNGEWFRAHTSLLRYIREVALLCDAGEWC